MDQVSRRELLATTLGIGTLGLGHPGPGLAAVAATAPPAPSKGRSTLGRRPPSTAPGWEYGPFDSIRDYVVELDRRGLVLHIPRIDQDAWEATALMYRLIDRYGLYATPTLLFDEVKIGGRWVTGPLLVNQYGHYFCEAVALGMEPVEGDGRATYRAAIERAAAFQTDGRFPMAPVEEVAAGRAPCKEVILSGDDIDITKFAWIQSNPADAGRYVNTGSVFTWDPELGGNFGTYRCQIRGPRLLGVNPEPGQTGWRMLTKMKERGDRVARVSIALGQDPLTWVVSTSKIGIGNKDELQLVSAMRGRPLQVVKSETNDIRVPAHSEMVIEGEIPLQEPMLPEGPFGEMRGYMGRKKDENFWMHITRVTHRRNPWIINQFTGVNRGAPSAVSNMSALKSLQARAPIVTMAHTPSELPGLGFVSIRKTKAGEALPVGKLMAQRSVMGKIIVLVDEDIDVLDTQAVMHAVGARWQPDEKTSLFLKKQFGHQLDPSLPENAQGLNKLVIDATRQLPEEGGPQVYQALNRTLLEEMAPEAVARVDAQWSDLVAGWKPPLV